MHTDLFSRSGCIGRVVLISPFIGNQYKINLVFLVVAPQLLIPLYYISHILVSTIYTSRMSYFQKQRIDEAGEYSVHYSPLSFLQICEFLTCLRQPTHPAAD